MRKTVVCAAVLTGFLAVAFSQTIQPLRASTGLWQMAETITWTKVPPEMAAMMGRGHTHNYTTCVKAADLRSNPWAQGSSAQCTWTTVTSTPTDMDVKGSGCELGMQGMTAEVRGKIHLTDPKNGTGSFDIATSGNGPELSGHAAYIGKWVSASCPAE